jgi:hypothetical protein
MGIGCQERCRSQATDPTADDVCGLSFDVVRNGGVYLIVEEHLVASPFRSLFQQLTRHLRY